MTLMRKRIKFNTFGFSLFIIFLIFKLVIFITTEWYIHPMNIISILLVSFYSIDALLTGLWWRSASPLSPKNARGTLLIGWAGLLSQCAYLIGGNVMFYLFADIDFHPFQILPFFETLVVVIHIFIFTKLINCKENL